MLSPKTITLSSLAFIISTIVTSISTPFSFKAPDWPLLAKIGAISSLFIPNGLRPPFTLFNSLFSNSFLLAKSPLFKIVKL